jgi:hypothetical protein
MIDTGITLIKKMQRQPLHFSPFTTHKSVKNRKMTKIDMKQTKRTKEIRKKTMPFSRFFVTL